MNSNHLEIKAETKSLVHTLTFANSVVEKRNVSPELSHIKLSAKDNMLELVATDGDLYLSQKIGAQILQEGEITVSTRLLSDIIRKIPDKEVTLKVIESTHQLDILGQNCYFSLHTLPADRFPTVSDNKAEAKLKLSCRDFAKIIDNTGFSVSNEETRYNLNGIYLHVKNGELYAASSDSHRLSVSSVPLEATLEEFGVIIPKKAVDEILKIVKDAKNVTSDIEIWLSVNKVKFICNDVVMISKLIEGIFPDYETFIPSTVNYILNINAQIFADAIDRVSTIAADKFRSIKLCLNKDKIEISASGEDNAAAKEKIACSKAQEHLCDYNSDEPLTIGFNSKYIMDVLSAVKSEQVTIGFTSPSAPTLITIPNNPKDIFVIMPVRV